MCLWRCMSSSTTTTTLAQPLVLWLTLWLIVLSGMCWSSVVNEFTAAAGGDHNMNNIVADVEPIDEHLVINVQNGGQEVYEEVITANTSQDIITLDYYESDGSLITQFIDFKAEVQIFRIYRLGEQDLNESQYKVYCFVTHLLKNDFISSDAMSKLRQRNPGAIRQPEEDKGKELYEMDLIVVIDKSSIISKHLPNLCSDAANQTYTREIDLRFWANTGGLTQAVHKNVIANTAVHQSCIVSASDWEPCLCHLQMCIAWYPCALKYCKAKDQNTSKLSTYRCGIKTCRKCRDFQFLSPFRPYCLWD